MKKSFEFDELRIGEVLGARSVEISDAMIRACAGGIETNHPWYFAASPYGCRIAPPTIFDNESLRMLDENYERFGSIHARQGWSFERPVRLGATVTLKVVVSGKLFKRDRPYLVMDLIATDESQVVLCRGRHTSLMTLQRKEAP